jgi:hypothetical protein
MKGQCCIVRPMCMPERGHGDGRLIRWRSHAGRMLGEPVARWDARGEFAATTAQILGERVAGAQSAWTGGGLACGCRKLSHSVTTLDLQHHGSAVGPTTGRQEAHRRSRGRRPSTLWPINWRRARRSPTSTQSRRCRTERMTQFGTPHPPSTLLNLPCTSHRPAGADQHRALLPSPRSPPAGDGLRGGPAESGAAASTDPSRARSPAAACVSVINWPIAGSVSQG